MALKNCGAGTLLKLTEKRSSSCGLAGGAVMDKGGSKAAAAASGVAGLAAAWFRAALISSYVPCLAAGDWHAPRKAVKPVAMVSRINLRTLPLTFVVPEHWA